MAPLTYPEKIAAIARIYLRNEQELGEAYAKRELRNMLNDMSAQLLYEMQAKRDIPVNLLELARTDWKEGERQ